MTFNYQDLNEDFIFELEKKISKVEKKIDELLTLKEKTYDNFFDVIEHLMDDIERFCVPLNIEITANITELGKKTYEKYIPIMNNFSTRFNQNEKIASAIMKIYEKEKLSDVRKRILEKQILAFKSSGIGLNEEDKTKIKSINLELSKLSNEFSQNNTDATNNYELIVEDESVLSEFPELDKKFAFVEEGKWKFTLHGPSLTTFLKYCNNRALREKIYKASATKALENEDIIEKISKLRDEKAHILGYKNFRELSIASKTAKNADEVIKFLTELGEAAYPIAVQEMEQLKTFAKEELNYDTVEIYDFYYLSRKFKEAKYSFDPAEVKPFFEKNRVVSGMFKFLEDTFNLKAKKLEGVKTWNEKALVYELERNGTILGTFIMDLETNEKKRQGAWASSLSTSYIKDGVRIPAVGYIVCNFPASKDEVPSLFDHNHVITLFHEMGHALHLMTSTVAEISASGFNGTEWDVVEYPSQWLQEFANNRAVIKTFARHYKTDEVIPDELITKMLTSENYGQAYNNNRQIEFGLFDLLIFDRARTKKEIQEVLDDVRKKFSPLLPPSYNKFQCAFSHIFAGGYGAGYYSYKWAEVLSADSYLEMTNCDTINKELANKFFDNLLALGGSVNMKESFVKVHGREPNPKALLKVTGIL